MINKKKHSCRGGSKFNHPHPCPLPSRGRESINSPLSSMGMESMSQFPLPRGERVRVRGNFQRKMIIIVALLGIFLTSMAIRHMVSPAESATHDDYEEHNEHDEEKPVQLSDAEMKEFEIEIGTAGPGRLQIHVNLPGEVVVNPDRLAHIVPRVAGVVREVKKNIGDHVRTGEVMAVLESRELADMKSAYLAAKERVALAKVNFQREERLWKKKVSAEQEYLAAKQALAEERIELRSAEQKLHALGFSEEYLAQLPNHPDITFTLYDIIAPFDGTVIEKHITMGEVLKDDDRAFVIADLNTVWVDLSIYQKDLPSVDLNQPVVISAGPGIQDVSGKIYYITPVVDEKTRTATARVVLPNTDGRWKPGLFVTGRVITKEIEVPILVPKTAIETMKEQSVVFIKTENGFKPQPVLLGRANETTIEILSGLRAGQRYVRKNGFTIKAEIGKSSLGEGHGH